MTSIRPNVSGREQVKEKHASCAPPTLSIVNIKHTFPLCCSMLDESRILALGLKPKRLPREIQEDHPSRRLQDLLWSFLLIGRSASALCRLAALTYPLPWFSKC